MFLIGLLIGLLLGIGLFCVAIQAYTLGLNHGNKLENKEIPTFIPSPIKVAKDVVTAVQEHKESVASKEKEKMAEEGWSNILNYNGGEV